MKNHPIFEIDFDLRQFAIDKVRDGIYWCDAQARILDVNSGACKMVGYSREELCTMKVSDLDPNYPIEKWPEHWDLVRKHGSVQFETIHINKDGRVINVEITANLINYKGQELNCAVVRDITERIHAQKKSEVLSRRHQALMESALEGIHIMDFQGNIVEANDTFCSMLGYTQEEMSRLNVADWDTHWSREELMERFKILVKSQSTLFETSHLRKDGTVLDVEISTTGVQIEDKLFLYASSRDITARKAAEKKINRLAFHDALTNLPNRQLLLDRIQQALASSGRSGRKSALLFIDLDNFKSLNDTLGHSIGDLLLQQVAQRLVSCVREGDTVARLGGDEFVVVLEDLSEQMIEAAEKTEVVGEKILAAVGKTYQLNTHEFHSTCSIGATLFSGDFHEAEELLKQADIAMYQSKKAGRNMLSFFDPQMQEVINTRVTLERELRKALDNRQFQLHYQVQVDSARRPIGAEALIRWFHPERGMVPAAQLVHLAEETGLILPIGLWVLDTACAQLRTWQADALTQNLTLAVNVSSKQFRQTDFVSQVENSVLRHGIYPRLLKLELTESILLEDIEATVITMNALKAIGVKFSLDDFGTGYSSLQYLKRLPLDQIKIDQSFVRDIATNPNGAAIVQTIIAMAEMLGLNVIAEGVETETQREFLELRGCQAYQGYLFGRPIPFEQFEKYLQHS